MRKILFWLFVATITDMQGIMAQEKITRTLDVHTHIIIPEYVEVLKAHGAELEETFPLPAWSAERHIAFMDNAGIRTAPLLIRRKSLPPHRWRCTNIRQRPPAPW